MRRESRIFRQISHTAKYRSIAVGFSEQPNLSPIWIRNGQRDLDERRLSRTVGTKQSENSSRLDREVHVPERAYITARPPPPKRFSESERFKRERHALRLYRHASR